MSIKPTNTAQLELFGPVLVANNESNTNKRQKRKLPKAVKMRGQGFLRCYSQARKAAG